MAEVVPSNLPLIACLCQVPVPMTQEEQVHVPKIITQTRIRHQPVEQIVEAWD